jgi:hypothetical protein
MGYRPYRGPVHTLGQAIFADLPVQVVCGHCKHFRQLHAFKLVQQIGNKADGRALPLFEPIKDLFYCRRCKKRVTAAIIAPLDYILR